MDNIDTIKFAAYGKDTEVFLKASKYANNDSLAIVAMTQYKPYCKVSVNVEQLPEDCFCVDINNMPENLLREIERLGIFEDTALTSSSGFCTYPI